VSELASFGNSFWSAAGNDITSVKTVVALLEELYVDVSKLASFGDSFWSKVAEDIDAVKKTIAMLMLRNRLPLRNHLPRRQVKSYESSVSEFNMGSFRNAKVRHT
jgi:hypothetical protein